MRDIVAQRVLGTRNATRLWFPATTCIPCSSTSLLECQLFPQSLLSVKPGRCFIMSNSSPIPSISPAHAANGRRDIPSTPGALAFLVHSQETVANKMPPEVDNKALARQRRRRTRYNFFYLHLLEFLSSVSSTLAWPKWFRDAMDCAFWECPVSFAPTHPTIPPTDHVITARKTKTFSKQSI
jgi:hypothetical protein